jgi:hypothetical protein
MVFVSKMEEEQAGITERRARQNGQHAAKYPAKDAYYAESD